MKIKFMSLALAAILLSSVVIAQEPDKASKQEEKFTERKAQMIKDLNAEKAGIDQVLGCANSAQSQDDMKKCYDLKKANMEKMREQRRAAHKERLQNELKKLEEEGKDTKK